MRFIVSYIDENNKRNSKIEEAVSEDAIISEYRSLNYNIIKIEEDRNISLKSLTNKKLKTNEIIEFLSQFNILIASGYSIKNAINILKDQNFSKTLSQSIAKIDDDLNKGYSFSKSLENTNDFPNLVTNIIAAAEESASMEESLNLLIDHLNEEDKLRSNIKGSLYYPIILIIVTLIVVFLIVSLVLPRYAELYSSFSNDELPIITLLLINSSKFLSNNIILLGIILISIFFILYKFISEENNKIKFHRFLLKIPYFGEYLSLLDLQKYCAIFSLTLSSGLDLLKVLDISAKTVNNKYLKKNLFGIKNKVNNGISLYESMKDIDHLPNIFLNLINIGEQSSSLDKTMSISYEYLSESLKNKSKKLISLFEPTVTIILGLIIGFIVLAIVMPSLNIINFI